MKNNKTIRYGLIVALLAIVTLSIISGTLAKYVETVKGTDSARVAKFDYEAKVGTTALTTDGVTINLFNTVNDAQVYGTDANLNSEKLVAPGTCGHFDVVATNKSEVDVDVTYSINETTNENVPIVYYVTNSNGTTEYYSSKVSGTVTLGTDVSAELGGATTATVSKDLSQMASDISETLAATDKTNATTATSTVGWFWAFGDGSTEVDSADTTLGKAGTASVAVEIKATFTQKD